MNFRQGPRFVNFRQDFRYYTVREYALMVVAALTVGVILALMLNALGGGPPAEQATLLKASRTERQPATNFAVVSYERREREAHAAVERLRAVREARHQRAVAARRDAHARAVLARAKPAPRRSQQQTQVTVQPPAKTAPQPVYRPAPRPAPAPTRSAEKKGGGTLQFDDSG
jgi:hypothetical protein